MQIRPRPRWPEQPPRLNGGAKAGRDSRWLILVALVFAAQLAIIFGIGAKAIQPPRAVANVPQLALADNSSELIALDDPTLFALPHANDFASENVCQPTAGFSLDRTAGRAAVARRENLGAVFTRFMQTNPFAAPCSISSRPPN
jgi:hypothetical protein